MSLQSRRNSLFKSSISIKSIGDSVQKFSKSLRGARRNADQAIKTIRQKNIFKRSLVRNDDLYFRKEQKIEKMSAKHHQFRVYQRLRGQFWERALEDFLVEY